MASLLSFYITMAAIMATAGVSTWLAFGGSPLDLLNRVLRWFRIPTSRWRIHGNWIIIRDQPGSITPIVVAKEIRQGLYDATLPVGTTCVDVGAHVGMFSIPLAKANPGAAFWAIEPDPQNYANLVHNIKRNGVESQVFPIHGGLSQHSGGHLRTIPGEPLNTGSTTTTASQTGCTGYTIKEILDKWDPLVLKIDVEGAEHSCIKPTDLTGVPLVIMEIHGHHGDPGPMLQAVRQAQDYVAQVIRHPTAGVYSSHKAQATPALQVHHA